MQALMKEPHIDSETVELKFVGPSGKRRRRFRHCNRWGLSIWARRCPGVWPFRNMTKNLCQGWSWQEPGAKKASLSENWPDVSGIPQRHISEMESSKRPIGKEMAKKFGKALHIDYRALL